jgi:hypothetical protein
MSHAEPIPHDAPAPPAFDAALWSRLQAMQIDGPDASLTFTRRLARENGWSVARAREVVEEYRRFLYLAARAGHPVTPSDAVDQAWHLHLIYTRHYWGVLCHEVLGFDLHHGPTLGGQREQAKFGDWYSRTLESYRSAFGEPPADIWPGVEDRFEGVEHMQRVDLGRSWVIPKPSLRSDGTLLRRLLAGLVMLLLAACLLFDSGSAATYAAAKNTGEVQPAVVVFIVMVIALLVLVFLVAETRSTLGSIAIMALLGLASMAVPRGAAIWTNAGIVGWCVAFVLLAAAALLFAHLYRTRDSRLGRQKKKSDSKNNSSGCGDGCGGGSGCGGGGCGGCGG